MDAAIALVTGLASGVLGGMLGIGGGLVSIPAMVLLLGTSQHTAQGVGLSVIVFTASVGASVHYRQKNVKLGTVLWIAPAATAFSILGVWASGMVTSQWLARAFAIFLLLVGIRMLLLGDRGGQDVSTS